MPRKSTPIDERFWSKVNKSGECWEWTASCNGVGYGQIDHQLAHRVVWELTNGPIPDKLHVLHTCDNRICVRPDHLFLGTPTDNVHDMIAKQRDRHAHGEDNGAAKLTAADVEEIRYRYVRGGVTQRSLADEYGVDQCTVSRIVSRRLWRHASGNELETSE